MRRLTIILALAGLFLLLACDIHTSGNGALDGYWQLATVDTLGGGSADVRGHKLFWAVQGDLLEMHHLEALSADRHYPTLHWRFRLNASELSISAPFAYDRTATDSLVTGKETVAPYGVSSLNETFKVLRLDNKAMTLESQVLRLYFKKF